MVQFSTKWIKCGVVKRVKFAQQPYHKLITSISFKTVQDNRIQWKYYWIHQNWNDFSMAINKQIKEHQIFLIKSIENKLKLVILITINIPNFKSINGTRWHKTIKYKTVICLFCAYRLYYSAIFINYYQLNVCALFCSHSEMITIIDVCNHRHTQRKTQNKNRNRRWILVNS